MKNNLLVLIGKNNIDLSKYHIVSDILTCNSIFEGATEKLDREIENKKLYNRILVINTNYIDKLQERDNIFLSYFVNNTMLNKFTLYSTLYNRTPYRYTDDININEIVIPSPYLYMCDSLTFNVLSSYREDVLNYKHDYRYNAKNKGYVDNFNPIHFAFFNVLVAMNIDIITL